MSLTAEFTPAHGAALRNVRPSDIDATRHAGTVAANDSSGILPRVETRIYTVFPERAARISSELRETARRRRCLLAMCAPTSLFLALAAWYLTL